MNILKLNKSADRRLKSGHLWIYSNEVDIKQTPLKTFAAGEQVVVETAQGKILGVAMVNPHTLICGRLVNTSAVALDTGLLQQRLQQALQHREACFDKPCYRLVYGESDWLPGLVIDRFGDYFSVQLNSAGMDAIGSSVVHALENLYKPKGILLRNDSSARLAEGLPQTVTVASGSVPDLVELEENHTRFVVPLANGQKTGWFYDHRINRREMQALVKNKSVLDIFSYVGGWGIEALHAGASAVTCVDSSELALDIAQQNATLNQQQKRFTALRGTAVDILKQLLVDKKQFDVVILDPPAFIKKAKDKTKGTEAYHHHNQLALKLLKPGGVLISASCSMHLKRDELMNVVRVAGNQLDRKLQVFYQGGQGPDHPVHPAIPETDYLKALFVRAL